MITLVGSQGKASFYDDGTAARYEPSDYPEIVNIDVDEWHSTYPDDTLIDNEHDVLDFGYWDKDWNYTPPCKDWRRERLINKALDCIDQATRLIKQLSRL